MSLDLLKNALYQALKASIGGLKIYPETIDSQSEVFPNLSWVEVTTVNELAKLNWETVQFPNPDTSPGAAPYLVVPVIARKHSTFRLQLRDSLGTSQKDSTAYQRVRDTHNQVDRFLVKTRAIKIGTTPGQTLAELWYDSDREAYDPRSGIFLHEYEIRFDPWRLLDAAPGITTYRADSIELDVSRADDGALLITRLYPLS
jgi:hypothetical protein